MEKKTMFVVSAFKEFSTVSSLNYFLLQDTGDIQSANGKNNSVE